MPILMLSDAMLSRRTAAPGSVLRDRLLSGLCVRVGRRTQTFMVATSVQGQQFRLTLGRWPLLSVEQARAMAAPIILGCRKGHQPAKTVAKALPTLKDAIDAYGASKGLRASSIVKYHSIVSTHFPDWRTASVADLGRPAFSQQCEAFAGANGPATVSVGRGLFGALIKYLNAVHDLGLDNPFVRLAAAGLMKSSVAPRKRRLQEVSLPDWKAAIDKLPAEQRDYLLLISMTGIRRGECKDMTIGDVDLKALRMDFPKTKTGHPHSLPITPLLLPLIQRRCAAADEEGHLFPSVAVEHVSKMAERVGAPSFMLHDLRKLVATMGERLGVGDAVMRRILNHTARRSDTLHRHYVEVSLSDIVEPLLKIQEALQIAMQTSHSTDRRG